MSSNIRFQAVRKTFDRQPVDPRIQGEKLSEIYCQNVFDLDTMREFLPSAAYKSVLNAIDHGEKIDRSIADQIASAMKDWASTLGATHYTHWFQPLTGSTAEKHDAFFTPLSNGRAIDQFGGEQLVQQEPDASSFPSGGIRNTFEARGYTAWDPTSAAFVIDNTLCIPTIFISYTGEALDNKTPLLRALSAVDEAATAVCKYFDKNINKVQATLGWEQEYFLVDSALWKARPDLVLTQRTLFGHAPAKGQQMDDHYFGTIPLRVVNFMKDFETEALSLGIPVTTRHNEVAPNQFEVAPMFEEANLAVDHNQLLMDVLDKVARRHHFRVLLHEKPFAGLNGSGKHNNWSLSTNTGVNLLKPGKNPKSNLLFLTFFINTIKAVHDYAGLLRASIASAANDHRLGANEAPPAIISVFIGSQLTAVLDKLETAVKAGALSPEDRTELKLNIVGKIPDVLLDNTDRNRTSPFAFTGNKFEFRAVGSSATCSLPMMILNTIMADQLQKFKKDVDDLIASGLKKDGAIFNVLRNYIKESKKIRFEGDGYSQEWEEHAAKLGLENIKSTPRALDNFVSEKALGLFSRTGVLNEREAHARHEVYLEQYMMNIQIEGRVFGDLARNHIIPTAVNYQNKLIQNVRGLKEVLGKEDYAEMAKEQLEMIKKISEHIAVINRGVEEMTDARRKANKLNDARELAIAYDETVKPWFDKIRYHVDKLEMMVDDELWPLPKYREMLFTR
jgi:glutamine synthetase